MKEFGIDISAWQGKFNLEKAKEQGAKFVILKCGGADDGYYKDSQFERNYKLAKELGLKVGAYYFSRGTNATAIEQEAIKCVNILKGKQFELPIYIDVENKKQLAIGKKTLTALVLKWLALMKEKGYYGGVYSSESYFETYLDKAQLVKYPLWIAKWSKTQPSNCGLWQFGGEVNYIRSVKVAGQTTDQNYLFIDYTDTIKKNGLNGYTKPAAKKEEKKMTKTCTVTLPMLRKGDKGDAVDTMQRLLRSFGYTRPDNKTLIKNDGIFGEYTEYALNEFQNVNLGGHDGICGVKTWKKLLQV